MSKGFSLIEIIITIAIISILTLITIPNFILFKKGLDLNNNVQEFVSILKFAQNKTLSSEGSEGLTKQYGIYINTSVFPNQYVLFQGSSYAGRNPSADQVNYLSDTAEFYNISLEGTPPGSDEIVFERLTGVLQGHGSVSIRLKSDPDKNKTVYITSSGTVTYDPPAEDLLDNSRIKDTRHIKFNYNRNIDTFSEIITLTFDNDQTAIIIISSYLSDGQLHWKKTTSVDGSDQVVEVNTVRLNNPDTIFSILRDRRYNDKSLKVTISGDTSGYLAQYSADGTNVDSSSIYVSNLERQ